jgi:hypothetical protein
MPAQPVRASATNAKRNWRTLAFAKDVDESNQPDSGGNDRLVVRLRKLPT